METTSSESQTNVLKQAVSLLEQAIELCKFTGNTDQEILCELQLGVLYMLKDDFVNDLVKA